MTDALAIHKVWVGSVFFIIKPPLGPGGRSGSGTPVPAARAEAAQAGRRAALPGLAGLLLFPVRHLIMATGTHSAGLR